MDRRAFLARSAALGCSLAASPLVTPVSFAAAPSDNRLVVIILRGGMDGLAAAAPYGDAAYTGLRGQLTLGPDAHQDLDGFFALHAGLAPLMPLWQAGELGFVHAVSTPYRDKRSHFDGQDLLEAGIANLTNRTVRDGWLNRMLAQLPGAGMDTAYAIGNDALTLLDGAAPVTRWTPEADLALSPQAVRLAQLVMQDDPAMSAALSEAFRLAEADGDGVAVPGGTEDMMSMVRADMAKARKPGGEKRLAEFAADRLRREARVAAFSLNGWDSHAAQDRLLSRSMAALSTVILTLKEDLGPQVWARTAVAVVTEFGRTARFNGTKGTDHGTAGAMILAGGAVSGGRVVCDWPGLADGDLYAGRDLNPTRDVRAHLAWLMRGLFGLSASTLEAKVFPGLDLGTDPALLL